MTELICQFCLCLAVAVQSGANCHYCGEVTPAGLKEIVSRLKDPEEFLSASCAPKGSKTSIEWDKKQGAIISKGGKTTDKPPSKP